MSALTNSTTMKRMLLAAMPLLWLVGPMARPAAADDRQTAAWVYQLQTARDDDDREQAAKTLGRLGDQAAISPLFQAAIYDPEDDVRDAARNGVLRLTGGVAPRDGVEITDDLVGRLMRQLLAGDDDDDRESAARSLGRLAEPRALSALEIAAVFDPDDDVRDESRESAIRIRQAIAAAEAAQAAQAAAAAQAGIAYYTPPTTVVIERSVIVERPVIVQRPVVIQRPVVVTPRPIVIRRPTPPPPCPEPLPAPRPTIHLPSNPPRMPDAKGIRTPGIAPAHGPAAVQPTLPSPRTSPVLPSGPTPPAPPAPVIRPTGPIVRPVTTPPTPSAPTTIRLGATIGTPPIASAGRGGPDRPTVRPNREPGPQRGGERGGSNPRHGR